MPKLPRREGRPIILGGLVACLLACAPGTGDAEGRDLRPLPLRAYCAVRDLVRSQDFRVRDPETRDLCADPFPPGLTRDEPPSRDTGEDPPRSPTIP